MSTLTRLLSTLALAAALFVPRLALADAQTGRTHAVLVGIADYPSSPLARTDVDAERIARALAANVPADRLRTHLLLNGSATRANVLSALAEVRREATEEDRVIFFFSGHGTPVADQTGDEGDQLDEVIALYDGHLSDDELAAALDETKSQVTLVGIDACFSGGFLFDVGAAAGRMTLFSSDEDLTSAVPQNEAGGWLSLLLAEALEGQADGVANGVAGQARDGQLTALELEVFIRQRSAQLPTIQASDPNGRTVGYQFIDIKRTGVRPDMVMMAIGAGNGEVPTGPSVATVATGLSQGTELARFPGERLSAGGAVHAIELQAGQRVLIETGALGGSADTVLEVRRGGQVLAQNDDRTPGDLSSRIELTASASGTYEVHVRPYAPHTLGSYTLRVAELGAAGGAYPSVEAGARRIQGQLAPNGEAHAVELTAGRWVLATGELEGAADTVLEVLLNGQLVAQNDDVTPGDLSSRVELDVPATATYTLRVRPYAPQTLGAYALTIAPAGGAAPTAPTTTPTTPGGVQVQGQLDADGEEHAVDLEAGRYAIATGGLSGAADTVLEVLLNGQLVAQNDDVTPGDLSSRVELDVPADGRYTLRVRPYAPQTLGSYTLTVTRMGGAAPGTTAAPSSSASVLDLRGQALGAAGQTHEVQLEAGRRYVVTTGGLTGATDTVLEVRRDGQVVAQNDDVTPGDLSSRVEL
ncbi:MAG TPA: caspase family protein, partial [Polyangiaceae bacterium LLY-WYZ-15_(1-7)]|nr:caspase family protein [Polyangiaceae bacterium LLY-WYZ-15_(1-7)]